MSPGQDIFQNDDGRFNVEANPRWSGVALAIAPSGVLNVAGAKPATIEFNLLIRAHAASLTSAGPYILAIDTKTGQTFRCHYYSHLLHGVGKEAFKHSPELGDYREIREKFSLTLEQLGLPRRSANYLISSYFGPTSNKLRLEIVVANEEEKAVSR